MRNRESRSMSWTGALVVAAVLMLGGSASESAAQQTRDALIQSFGEEIQAINGKDLNDVMSHVHEEVVLFGLYSPFPAVGKRPFARPYKTTLTPLRRPTSTRRMKSTWSSGRPAWPGGCIN